MICSTKGNSDLRSSKAINWRKIFVALVTKATYAQSITLTNQKENKGQTWTGTSQKMKPTWPINAWKETFLTHQSSKNVNGWQRVGKKVKPMEGTLRTVCFWCTNWFNYFGQQFAMAKEDHTCACSVAQQSCSWGCTLEHAAQVPPEDTHRQHCAREQKTTSGSSTHQQQKR